MWRKYNSFSFRRAGLTPPWSPPLITIRLLHDAIKGARRFKISCHPYQIFYPLCGRVKLVLLFINFVKKESRESRLGRRKTRNLEKRN